MLAGPHPPIPGRSPPVASQGVCPKLPPGRGAVGPEAAALPRQGVGLGPGRVTAPSLRTGSPSSSRGPVPEGGHSASPALPAVWDGVLFCSRPTAPFCCLNLREPWLCPDSLCDPGQRGPSLGLRSPPHASEGSTSGPVAAWSLQLAGTSWTSWGLLCPDSGSLGRVWWGRGGGGWGTLRSTSCCG